MDARMDEAGWSSEATDGCARSPRWKCRALRPGGQGPGRWRRKRAVWSGDEAKGGGLWPDEGAAGGWR